MRSGLFPSPVTQVCRRYGRLRIQQTPTLPNSANFNLYFFHQLLAWKFPLLPRRESRTITELFLSWIKYQKADLSADPEEEMSFSELKGQKMTGQWRKTRWAFIRISFSFSPNYELFSFKFVN